MSKTYLIIILDFILLCIHLHSSLKWHKFFKLQWNLQYEVYIFSEMHMLSYYKTEFIFN